MKLSKNQQRVINLMKEGWELGASVYTGRVWLQKNGLGRGGETEDISSATLGALQKRGLVKYVSRDYPQNLYQLTEKGRQ